MPPCYNHPKRITVMETMNLLIRNGRVIDPANAVNDIRDLLVTDGKIQTIARHLEFDESQCSIVDATNMIVCPGFVDLHCHLRQPGYEEKETIASGTLAAAKGGFTTVCCMPNTNPPIASATIIKQVYDIADQEGAVRVLPIAAVTKDRTGNELSDMLNMQKSGAVAFSDDGSPVWDSTIMRRALEYSKDLNTVIINHCEDLILANDGVMNSGIVAGKLGYKGIPNAAEDKMVERDIQLARETGGRLHIAHVSTKGSVELIRQAKEQGITITAEVTPHHLTLTEDAVTSCGTAAKVNPPLRTGADVRALIDGLRDGTIDAIATDHAPHTRQDKAGSFEGAAFGISAFETTLGSLMMLVNRGDIDLPTVISKLTVEPSKILGHPEVTGNLKPGLCADITIFNPNSEWTVDPDTFLSKGQNTPLTGNVLKGEVVITIANGSIAYRASS